MTSEGRKEVSLEGCGRRSSCAAGLVRRIRMEHLLPLVCLSACGRTGLMAGSFLSCHWSLLLFCLLSQASVTWPTCPSPSLSFSLDRLSLSFGPQVESPSRSSLKLHGSPCLLLLMEWTTHPSLCREMMTLYCSQEGPLSTHLCSLLAFACVSPMRCIQLVSPFIDEETEV